MIIAGLLTFLKGNAQSYSDLNELTGFSIKAYYSPGNEERARLIVGRCEKTIKYVNELVGFTPTICVLILNPEQWKKYSTLPIYGMPHYQDNGTLVIAS
ncbi:MAG: hypothetical protein HGA83_09730, partial [Bacteroidales bacterium]|nr:hypothetical protein [Bacteroidales bacterium]